MLLLLWFLNTDRGLFSGCHGDLTVVVVVVVVVVVAMLSSYRTFSVGEDDDDIFSIGQ